MIYRWVYVSRCLLAGEELDSAIRQIVSWSVERNRQLGVTGALVCSATRFAQYLEGDRGSVLALKRSISADPRHCDLIDIHEDFVEGRLFGDWSLLYAASSRYFDRLLASGESDMHPSGWKAPHGVLSMFREIAAGRAGGRPPARGG